MRLQIEMETRLSHCDNFWLICILLIEILQGPYIAAQTGKVKDFSRSIFTSEGWRSVAHLMEFLL
jgi:hypothetical protein